MAGAREFSPCFADCGSYGPGEAVTIEFDDVLKLLHNYEQYDRLVESGYKFEWDPEEAYRRTQRRLEEEET